MGVNLCQTCQNCLEGRAKVRRLSDQSAVYAHYQNLDDLESSAATGCRFCSTLLSRNASDCRGAIEVDLEMVVDGARGVPRISLHARIKRAKDGNIFSTCTPTTLLGKQQQGFTQSEDTGSDQSLDFVRDRLALCCAGHNSQCRNIKQWWPTRLLDVDCGSLQIFRLLDSKKIEHTEPYITLSHCWGLAQPMKLQSSTEAMLREGCAVEILPKTFQDAISVCRYLRVRYLWIDSLCIFQEGKDDWLGESALMDKVYSNSLCTLAATASTDGDGGLFRSRQPVGMLQLDSTEGAKLSAGSYAVLNVSHPGASFDYLSRIKDGPLNQRAWVYQERILSTRVVHFTEDEIIWECGGIVSSDLLPDGIPKSLLHNEIGWKDEARPKELLALASQKNSVMGNKHTWDIVHKAYANTRLTFPTDRVLALAGLAKYFQCCFQDTYVVGMWRQTLHINLVWEVPSRKWRRVWSETDKKKLSQYRAPSWSWLSVEGTTYLSQALQDQGDNQELKFVYEIIDVHMAHITDDQTGLVKHGSLYLRGILVPIALGELKEHMEDCYPYWSFTLVGFEQHDGPINSFPDYGKGDLPNLSQGHEHYCMPLVIRNDHVVICMLLEISKESENAFRRIGLGEIHAKYPGSGGISKVVDQLRGMNKPKDLPCVNFDKTRGECTVCVV